MTCPLPRQAAPEWREAHRASTGWSSERLKDAEAWKRQIDLTAVMVMHHGAVLWEWGDRDDPFEPADCRFAGAVPTLSRSPRAPRWARTSRWARTCRSAMSAYRRPARQSGPWANRAQQSCAKRRAPCGSSIPESAGGV